MKEAKLRIGILGTGNVGFALGQAWLKAGHSVCFGSRTPSSDKSHVLLERLANQTRVLSPQAALDESDVVLVAIPWPHALELAKNLQNWEQKLLLDCINPLTPKLAGLATTPQNSTSEILSRAAPGARVAKVFNTCSYATLLNSEYSDSQADVPYCAETSDRPLVESLIRDASLNPLFAGPIDQAHYLEQLALITIKLGIVNRWGGNCAIKILSRSSP